MNNRPPPRLIWRSLLGVFATALVVIAAGPPTGAASYRYWSYWWAGEGTWIFATAGPASSVPADGSVEGWRFGITGVAGGAQDAPSQEPTGAFDRACAGTPERDGHKRVAVVIDPGPASAAPSGDEPGAPVLACASVEVDANGYQVLRSLAEVRTEDGLVCAIGGYPSTGCAEIVTDGPIEGASGTSSPTSSSPTSSSPTSSSPTTSETRTGSGPLPLIIGGLAIGAMLGFIWRRRRSR